MRKLFAIYAITRHGLSSAEQLWRALPGSDLFVSPRLEDEAPAGCLPLPLPMGPTLAETFDAYDCHVHVISVGAVVRMIAPLIKSKKTDPAIVCVDDAARFAVCLLSGHVGRGNEFTERVAGLLGAEPVVTTASDVRRTLTVDILGRELGWVLDDDDRNVTLSCAAVVNEAPVLLVQETGEPGWWPEDRPLPPGVSVTTSLDGVDPGLWEALLIVSDRDVRSAHPAAWEKSVVYRPRSLVLGVGCDRGTPVSVLVDGIDAALLEAALDSRCIAVLATVDAKADEQGLIDLAQERGWEFVHYPAAELDVVEGVENPSETVRKFVGTRSVAEAACLLSAGASRLLLPKRRHRDEAVGRSMTVAIARRTFSLRQELASHAP